MNWIKRTLRLMGFIIMITMASMGLGINAAILPQHRRQDMNEAKVEQVETKEESEAVSEDTEKR